MARTLNGFVSVAAVAVANVVEVSYRQQLVKSGRIGFELLQGQNSKFQDALTPTPDPCLDPDSVQH